MLRNNLIRLPVVRCQFGEMNAKYQMHLRLRNLATPGYICNLNDFFLYMLIQIKLLGTLYPHISCNQSEMHVSGNKNYVNRETHVVICYLVAKSWKFSLKCCV